MSKPEECFLCGRDCSFMAGMDDVCLQCFDDLRALGTPKLVTRLVLALKEINRMSGKVEGLQMIPDERDQIQAPPRPDLHCRDHEAHSEMLHRLLDRIMRLESRVATLEDRMKNTGFFPDPLIVEDLNGSRNFVLSKPFRYVDSAGVSTTVHEGFVWNGASIPRFFWRVFGSPFVGRHRKPSVIHDCLWVRAQDGQCSFRHANFQFWDALRSSGVGCVKAWLMWAAVALNSKKRRPEK